MANIDISDLHGVLATPLRWNAETGVLAYGSYDEASGERELIEIELGSPTAKFAMDLRTRERGYGMIRQGLYDMRLSPVGEPAPEWPGDDAYKAAVACWVWTPLLGELRLETNQTTLLRTITGVWDRARTFREAAEGFEPIVHFIGRRDQPYRRIGKVFQAPIVDIVGWVPRDKIPAFAMREPTVKAPSPLDKQVRAALLGGPKQASGKTKAPTERDALGDLLDEEIPDNL